MDRNKLLLLGLIGLGIVAVLGTGGYIAVAAWQQSQNAKKWIPVIHAAENKYGIPPDLLARMAYQESHFRDDIIQGTTGSGVGAMGILQLMPASFPNLNLTPPFDDQDTTDQINAAAAYLAQQYRTFGDWGLALAAYNAGPGNVKKYGDIPPFAETQNYVSQILADVPVPGASLPGGDSVPA